MNWTPIKKKKPSEQIQEYLDSQKPGGRVLNTPVNRIQTQPQFPGNTPLRQTATQRPFFAGPTEVIHAPKAPDTTVHQGSGTIPNVVVTPEKPKTYEWPNVDQQTADLELAQKKAHIAAFADQMAAMDAEFWRIAQNPGSMLGANESPYYSLYMKQYQQRARDRETNAYNRASEGTGGYGSSFATMAGEQAYRETMQEFDELAPTLIKSKSERMAEILQEREMLKAMGDRINAESNTLTLEDGTTVEVTDAARELYAGYLDSFTQGTGYDTLKTAMINGGASEADADQAIAMFKKLGGATVADKISSFELNPTLDMAQEIWDEARRAGKEKEYLPKLSAGVSSMSAKNLDAAKTDEEEAGILLNAKSAFEAGYLTAENYADVYIHAVENDIKKNSGSKKKDKYKNIIKNYGDVAELAEQGQIPPEVADKIADWLINDTNISDNFIERYDNKGNVIGYSVQSATGPFAFTKKEEELLYDMITHKLTKEKLLGIQK